VTVCDDKLKIVLFILELVQFERQKVNDACRDAENLKAKEVCFVSWHIQLSPVELMLV